MRFLSASMVLLVSLTSAETSDANTADRWKTHLTENLLPFWSEAQAAGAGSGSFPGNICNDGSLPVSGTACGGVSSWRARNPQQTLVAQSRQVFSYAIAYHMTGQKAYLDLAQAGLEYQFDTFLDADTGLFHEVHDVKTGSVSGDFNSQKQAYGLLGAGFVYYLTGDQSLYDRIKPIEAAITDNYRIANTGSYTVQPKQTGPANTIAHHLDQLNAYKTLLAAHAPVEDRAQLLTEAVETAEYLKSAFYDESTGLMRPTLQTPEGTFSDADFGHSIKSFWFIDQTAQLAGDDALARFAQDAAKTLFKLAYQEDLETWATNLDVNGDVSAQARWWSFAELNQYAVTLAIGDPELHDLVAKTQSYWLDVFVDPDNDGVWRFVDITTGTPDSASPKHWEWKAGFHSYEHALINYMSDAAIAGEDATLYFARDDVTDIPLAYGFSADLTADAPDADGTTLTRLTNISFAAAVAPVPLPATFGVLLVAVLSLRGLSRPIRGLS